MKNFLNVLIPLFLSFGFYNTALAQAFQGLQIEAGAELPTQFSARLKAIINNNFYLSGGLGYSASFLTDSSESFILNVEEEASYLMSRSMGNSFIIELRGGWQQNADKGFYIEGGYSYSSGGNGEVEEIDVEDFLLLNLPSSASRSIDVETSLHSLTIHAGYQFALNEKLLLKLEGGFIKPVKSENSLSPNEGSSISSFYQDEYDDEMKSAWSSAYILSAGAYIAISL